MEDIGVLYQLIIRLPVLKYGNFSLTTVHEYVELLVPDNEREEYSNIEHLIINSYHAIHQLSTILSYMPQLRHLSCEYLSSIGSIRRRDLIVPSNLTHISMNYCLLSFDAFEAFIFKFCPQLQLLRISIRFDDAYLNAERWERLIYHMPHLRIFDFQHKKGSKTTMNTMHIMQQLPSLQHHFG